MSEDVAEIKLPWRATGLDGFSTEQGPTFNGGSFHGGGPRLDRSLSVRLLQPMGRAATVQLDLTDRETHGCSVSLNPDVARQVAAALVTGADQAEAEMARYRAILDEQRKNLREVLLPGVGRTWRRLGPLMS